MAREKRLNKKGKVFWTVVFGAILTWAWVIVFLRPYLIYEWAVWVVTGIGIWAVVTNWKQPDWYARLVSNLDSRWNKSFYESGEK